MFVNSDVPWNRSALTVARQVDQRPARRSGRRQKYFPHSNIPTDNADGGDTYR